MVATTHWLASATGMAVLEDGGNAFDAAVAAGFVLQVAEPHLNGPAGQVPAIFATAQERKPRVLCGQGVSPAAATPAHFRDLGLDLIPGSGLLAATVPGAWDAWLLLLRDYGTKSLRDVRNTPSRTRGRAFRWSAGSPRPSTRSPNCSPTIGPARPNCGCPGAKPQPPDRCTATARSPARGNACSDRPRCTRAARRRSTRPGAPGHTGSWRRPSTSSAGRRSVTIPVVTTRVCSPATTWRPGRRRTRTR